MRRNLIYLLLLGCGLAGSSCDRVAAFSSADPLHLDGAQRDHAMDGLDAGERVDGPTDVPRRDEALVPRDGQPPSEGPPDSAPPAACPKSATFLLLTNDESFDLTLDQANKPHVLYVAASVGLQHYRGDLGSWPLVDYGVFVATRLAATIDSTDRLHVLYSGSNANARYESRKLSSTTWEGQTPVTSSFISTSSVALTSDPSTNTVYGAIVGATIAESAIARFRLTSGTTTLSVCPVRPVKASLRLDTAARGGYFIETRLTSAIEGRLLASSVTNRCNAATNATIDVTAKFLDAVAFEPAKPLAHLVHVDTTNYVLRHRRADAATSQQPLYKSTGLVSGEPGVVAVAYDPQTKTVNIVYRETGLASLLWSQSSDAGQTWSVPVSLHGFATTGGRVRAVARAGALHVLFSEGSTLRYVCQAL